MTRISGQLRFGSALFVNQIDQAWTAGQRRAHFFEGHGILACPVPRRRRRIVDDACRAQCGHRLVNDVGRFRGRVPIGFHDRYL